MSVIFDGLAFILYASVLSIIILEISEECYIFSPKKYLKNIAYKQDLWYRGKPLSTYAKYSEKLTFLCAYQGVRNVSFSENLAYVLNGWPLNMKS